jgi:hypothetical protein
MSGEQEAIASVEPETPAIEQEVEREPEADTAEQAEPAVAEEEFDELDFGFQKYSVPKKLKADVEALRTSFTQKTQEFAAKEKALEARANQQAQANEQELQLRGQLYGLQSEIVKYEQVNWEQWEQDDPMAAGQGWRRYQQLQQQAGVANQYLQQHQQQRSSEAQQDLAKRMNETQQFAQEKIPGWTSETDKQVIDFALSKGATREMLSETMSPLVYEMLYLARIGAQTLSKPAATTKPQTPPPAPLKVVAAKANPPARKSFGEMSMDEYVAARSAGRGG